MSFAYQWRICNANGDGCSSIAGATAPGYQVRSADVGSTIRVAVTATNTDGSSTARSTPTPRVVSTATAPANVEWPTITGSTSVGNTLTAHTGNWRGTNPISYGYHWTVCDGSGNACHDIGGATSATYTLQAADHGNTIRVAVTATNAGGSSTARSVPTAVIAAGAAPANTKWPTIGGNPTVGATLTAGNGDWSGVTPMSFKYQWLVCDGNGNACRDVAGATGASYQVRSEDQGDTLRVAVTATNSSGSSTARSVQTGGIGVAPAPAPQGCPKLAAGARAVSVASVGAPARLQIANFRSSVLAIHRGTRSFSVRFHVTDTCGQAVQGAQVYATAVPYRQVSVPAQKTTNANGDVTMRFRVLNGFPANPGKQQLMVMFVRAVKPGDTLLAGVSTRRLISLRVDLRA